METVTAEPAAKRKLRLVESTAVSRPEALLSGSQTAALWGVSIATIERRVADGTLPNWIRIGPRCRRAVNGEQLRMLRLATAGGTAEELRQLAREIEAARKRAA